MPFLAVFFGMASFKTLMTSSETAFCATRKGCNSAQRAAKLASAVCRLLAGSRRALAFSFKSIAG